MHRVSTDAFTVGASSGNEVVVRARGVAGRHIRLFERNGRYHLDLFKGVGAVSVNGREFTGGAVTPGDRITIGEATITILGARPALRQTPINEIPVSDTAVPVIVPTPTTEVEYRVMRLAAYRLCQEFLTAEDLATRLVDFLDKELDPTEWAAGQLSPVGGFRPLASTFLENPALPPRLLEDFRAGERVVRAETVTGVLTLIAEPSRGGAGSFALLVRESPRLPARAILFLEELVLLAGRFEYAIGPPVMDLTAAPYGGARYPVEDRVDERIFARFHLDAGIGDVIMQPLETIVCRDWLGFAGIEPSRVRMIAREQQFAEKIHAYTLPPEHCEQ